MNMNSTWQGLQGQKMAIRKIKKKEKVLKKSMCIKINPNVLHLHNYKGLSRKYSNVPIPFPTKYTRSYAIPVIGTIRKEQLVQNT